MINCHYRDNILFRSRGYCENLMDDLVLRMEQYANNLEALVEEKTDQLSQEKRRSEELLFQVLPRLVLMRNDWFLFFFLIHNVDTYVLCTQA